jgi:uncharacterized membrane protein YoaT (DUF817 family)
LKRELILMTTGCISLFIWLAENIGTISGAWLYPNQTDGWVPVSPAKLGSWFLLMIISFVLANLVHQPKTIDTGN